MDGSVFVREIRHSRNASEQFALEAIVGHSADARPSPPQPSIGDHDGDHYHVDGDHGARCPDDDDDHLGFRTESSTFAAAGGDDKDWPESVLPHGHISSDDDVSRGTGLGDYHDESVGAERRWQQWRPGHKCECHKEHVARQPSARELRLRLASREGV